MNVDKYTDQYFLLPKYKVDLQNNKIFASIVTLQFISIVLYDENTKFCRTKIRIASFF